MFASTYGMPPHGYPPFAPYTTTPLNSPPLGGVHGPWEFSNTPAPTPQPQSSPYSNGTRSRQSRRRSEQIPSGGPSFPSTPQPNRNSATPGVYPFYNTPSPRPSYGGVPSPKPGQGDFYYPIGPGGPIPPATPAFSPQAHPAEFEYVSPSRSRPSPRPSPRLSTSRSSSRNSPRITAVNNFRAQRLHRKHSHIDSDNGGDDDEDPFLNCPYCYPIYNPMPAVPYVFDSPNVEFKYNVEQYYDETYESEGFEADTRPDQDPQFNPPSRERGTRSRNSGRTRTPGDMPKSPGFPEEGRKSFSPSREEQILAENDIPAAFARKNWDRQERPIALLGSVFDANSLGKWIYDWTVFYHSAQSSTTEMAGEMWLLLIQLSGKMKRAQETMSRVHRKDNREVLQDFLESGDRLWTRMKRLLKHCESYMWDGALKDEGLDPKNVNSEMRRSPAIKMGKSSGKEFVTAMFSPDRELERTNKLMTGMNLWQKRFEANCEEILKNPYA